MKTGDIVRVRSTGDIGRLTVIEGFKDKKHGNKKGPEVFRVHCEKDGWDLHVDCNDLELVFRDPA